MVVRCRGILNVIAAGKTGPACWSAWIGGRRLLVDIIAKDLESRPDTNPRWSRLLGIDAGILVTPITLTSYDVGTLLALKGFVGAMLGGIGSAFGAVVEASFLVCWRRSAQATFLRIIRMRSHSWLSSLCCSLCRRASSVEPRSNGCEHACTARLSFGAGRSDRGDSPAAAAVLPINLLLQNCCGRSAMSDHTD